MNNIAVVFAILVCVDATPTLPAANKCNSAVIAAINKLWGKKVPTNIIRQSKAAGKEFVVATTPGYYPEEMGCVYSFFSAKYFTISYVFEDGFRSYQKVLIKESKGVLIDTKTGIKRYQVYSKGGVSAYYKCHDKGRRGKPEGLIKIKDKGHKESELFHALRLMERLGVKINTGLSSDCPTINNTARYF